jgi:hypothetical protein
LKLKGWLLLLFILILIAAGGALGVKEVLTVQMVNSDRPRKTNILTAPGSRLTISYIHSIYLQPAAEEFEVGEGDELILRGVRTKSPAVAAYYGFEDGREYYASHRRMKSFLLRLGMSTTQIMAIGSQKISLEKLGEKGDRVEVSLVRMKLGQYLLSRLIKENR